MADTHGRTLHCVILVSLLFTSSFSAPGAVIRLVGSGSTRCSGRLEVFHNGTWGTVCDDSWDINDAQVVCRQLNCGTAVSAPGSAHYGQGSDPIWLDDVACSGSESSVTECQHRGFGIQNCGHGEDASVICSDTVVRLAGSGSTRCSGRVEVFHDGTWGTVCDDSWDLDDAEVVCRQLNCGSAVSAPGSARFGQGSEPTWLDDVGCSGNESSVTECQHRGFGVEDCGHGEDAGVICSVSVIRLAGSGSTRCSGRVEVLHEGTWGTVCDDGWDLDDAEVVCRQLNCGTALDAPGSALFGPGSEPTWLDDVGCSGNERSVTECKHGGFGKENCGHGEDASIICSASLPKPGISMTPAGGVTLGQSVTITCSVSAEFLDGTFSLMKSSGSPRNPQTSTSNSATFVIPTVTFDTDGSYHCQYEKNISSQTFRSPSSDPIALHVTVIPEQPSMSVTSPGGDLLWGPEGPEVPRGHSIVITCSITTGYPGGIFNLISSNSNVTTSVATVNNSASFMFPGVEYHHQGNYSCVYEVSSSTHKAMSPPSAPVYITIKASLLLLVLLLAVGGLLLFLLVCMVAFLIQRRRRSRSSQSGMHVQTQIFSGVANLYGDEDDDEDGEEDYVNVDKVYTGKNLKEPAGKVEDERELDDDDDDAHDYEEAQTDESCVGSKGPRFDGEESRGESERGGSRDDEADYENLSQPLSDQHMNIYDNYDVCGRL